MPSGLTKFQREAEITEYVEHHLVGGWPSFLSTIASITESMKQGAYITAYKGPGYRSGLRTPKYRLHAQSGEFLRSLDYVVYSYLLWKRIVVHPRDTHRIIYRDPDTKHPLQLAPQLVAEKRVIAHVELHCGGSYEVWEDSLQIMRIIIDAGGYITHCRRQGKMVHMLFSPSHREEGPVFSVVFRTLLSRGYIRRHESRDRLWKKA